MKLITVKMPERIVGGLDQLVTGEIYPSRSAAIRVAVRDLLKEVRWMAETNMALMEKTISFKRWILVACPLCRELLHIRRDWKTRRCSSCREKFTVDFDKLLIMATFEKVNDGQLFFKRRKFR